MPVAEDQRLKFFVYIVESPSAPDLYLDRSEGDFIKKAVELNGLPCVRRTTINREAFTIALVMGLVEDMKAHPGRVPIIHISAHGYDNGIALSSGEVVEWNHLRDLLRPINKALSGGLLVCMSTCKGFSGTMMAMDADPNAEHPFFALIGNSESPTWPETAVGFATLYHQLVAGAHISKAVEAMQVASGNDGFLLEWASNSHKYYIDFLKTMDTSAAADELQQQAGSASQPADAKFLRPSSQ